MAPLSGAPGARRCLFLDRDGVINAAPPKGEYIRRWEEIRLLPEAISWIRLFKTAGFLVIVLTNQRGIALGLYSTADLEALHAKLREALAAEGAVIDDIFYCPHQEGECHCRKPEPGMVLAAQKKWGIDLSRSLLVGDSERDRLLAERCGIPFVRVNDGRIMDVVFPPGAPARPVGTGHPADPRRSRSRHP